MPPPRSAAHGPQPDFGVITTMAEPTAAPDAPVAGSVPTTLVAVPGWRRAWTTRRASLLDASAARTGPASHLATWRTGTLNGASIRSALRYSTAPSGSPVTRITPAGRDDPHGSPLPCA